MLYARALAVPGGLALAASAALAWIRVQGLDLELELLGARAPAAGTTVSGIDTHAAIPVIALGTLAAALGTRLGASRAARLVTGLIGLLAVLGAAGLAYYAWNLVDIELAGEPPALRVAADAVIDGQPREGLGLMGAAGVALLLGAVAAPPKERPTPAD